MAYFIEIRATTNVVIFILLIIINLAAIKLHRAECLQEVVMPSRIFFHRYLGTHTLFQHRPSLKRKQFKFI